MYKTAPPTLTEPYPQMSPDTCSGVLELLSAALDEKGQVAQIARLLEHQPILNYTYTAGQTFWRARRLDQGARFEHESDLLWPPTSSAAGRAHREGTPMLYVAAKRDTALAECDAQSGDQFQMVGIRINPNAHAGLSHPLIFYSVIPR